MDKLDIAYQNFRNRINTIIQNERNKCRNSQINSNNNNSYLDSIDNLVVSLKNYRGISRSYSATPPNYSADPAILDAENIGQPIRGDNQGHQDHQGHQGHQDHQGHQGHQDHQGHQGILHAPDHNLNLRPTQEQLNNFNKRKEHEMDLHNSSCANYPNITTSTELRICRDKCGDEICLGKFNNNNNNNNNNNTNNNTNNNNNNTNSSSQEDDRNLRTQINSRTPVSCQLHCDFHKPGSTIDKTSGNTFNSNGESVECKIGEECENVYCMSNGQKVKEIQKKCIL